MNVNENRLMEAVERHLDKRSNNLLAYVDKKLDELGKPIRTGVEEITRVDDGRTIVSRHQPTDPLYRALYRENAAYKDCRTPELDHWNHQFLLGLIDGDKAIKRDAYDKANAVYARATTLEGAIDATDPTAVLGGTGGDLLAQPSAQVVQIGITAVAVIRNLARIYPMTGATLRIPTAGAATAAKRTEGVAGPQGEGAYDSKMLRAEWLTVFMKTSREFVADSPFGVVTLFSELAGAAIGTQEDIDFCTSDGVAPNASEKIVGGDIAETSPTVLQFEDFSKLYRAVAKPYRGSGTVWLGNSVTLGLVDIVVDGNGQPVMKNPTQPPLPFGDSPGNEGFLYRHPVFEVPLADGQLLFGNVRKGYAIGLREGISVRVSDQAEFAAGLLQFMIEERYDGLIQDAVAMKQFTGLATVA